MHKREYAPTSDRIVLLVVTLLIGAGEATADREPATSSPDGWLVGIAHVHAPDPFRGDVENVSRPVPLIGYIGERLTWLGPHLGYTLLQRRQSRITAVAEIRFQGIDEDVKAGPLEGLRARRPAIEAGADISYGLALASLRVDASGRHDGHELSFALRHEWGIGDAWRVGGRVGAVWQSDRLTRHLYGVSPSEARPGLPEYRPGSALHYEAAFNASRTLAERWLAFGSLSYRALDRAASSSPILHRSHELSYFVGIAYRVGRLRP